MKLIWEVAVPISVNREREIVLNHCRLWARLGPMDVPSEVMITRQNKRVIMELHYATQCDEKLATVEAGTIRLTTGKASGRVFCIECDGTIDVDELKKPLQQLQSAAARLDAAMRPHRLCTHYRLIADDVLPHVIDEIKHELMRESR